MKTSSLLRLAIPVSLFSALATSAHAGLLGGSPLSLTVGSGTATALAVTTSPNNYPTGNVGNNITSNVTLNTGATALDLVFVGLNSNGITSYSANVTVTNGTGVALNGYSFQLGSGTGTAFTRFTGTGATTGIPSFLPATPAPTSNTFPTAVLSNELLTYSGATLAAGGVATFNFNVAIPDFAGVVPTFTLRETPQAVPEPSAFAALGLGAVVVLRRRKKA